jgi:hypothetical protein
LPAQFVGRPFSVREAGAAGMGEKRMLGRDLARPFHGVRSNRPVNDDIVERCRAYTPRMPSGHVFSHETAARLWGIPLPAWMEHDRVHVASFDGSNRPRTAGVVGHQLTDPALRLVERHGIRVLDPATVWLQLAARLRVHDLVAAADHLVLTPRRGDPDDPRPYVPLGRLADRARRFRGRGRRTALAAMLLVRDGAESPRETALRLVLVENLLPEPALNEAIVAADGTFIGYGDLTYPDHRIVVEYDGEQHRTDARQYYGDIERHEALLRAGWVHIRETKVTPAGGPHSTVARTRQALLSRGWQGTPAARPLPPGESPNTALNRR